MRITQNQNFETMYNTISRTKARMNDLQGKAATLKKVNAPSDDPVGAAKLLEIRTEKVNTEQFKSNSKLAESLLNNTEQAMSEIGELILRAKEIAVQQSSAGNGSEDTRLGIAEEVRQLYQQGISIANRRIGDRYIFGGYRTNVQPVDTEGRYHGDDGQVMIEVARDVHIATNLPGMEAFNTKPESSSDYAEFKQRHRIQSRDLGDPDRGVEDPFSLVDRENVNVFGELEALRIGLLTGNTEAIQNTLERFDDLTGRVSAMRAQVGSRVNGLQTVNNSLERQTITHAQLSSEIEDADLARVMSDIAREEVVLKAALSAGNKLVQPTLTDFLR